MFFEYRLTTKAIFFDRQTLWLFCVYAGLRLLSWFLMGHVFLQGLIMFFVIMAFGILYYERPDWAWYVLITELLLGGAGHFLDLFGLSLRSVLTITFLVLWIAHSMSSSALRNRFKIKHHIYYIGFPFFFFCFIAFLRGALNGHNMLSVIQDAVPYMYFLLLYPAYHFFQEVRSQEYVTRLLLVFVFASAAFSLFTFFLFTTDGAFIHGEFYNWFRDVAAGKITDMGNGFFRIVLPEHLLHVPIILVISSLLMRDEKHHPMWRYLLFSALFVLVLNFSRGFLLALAVGMLVLFWKHKVIEWAKETAFAATLFLSTFFIIHILASGFSSTGLELLGLRATSLAAPTIEVSSATRMALVRPIMQKIEKEPILGHGFGASVTYTDPVTKELRSTTQFDWGYLEMWAELGFFGAGLYMILLFVVVFELIQKTRSLADYHDFYVGLLASVVAFLVMNITAPALFHVFGIISMVLIITYIMKPSTILDGTITHLYRIFHRLHLPKFH